MSSSGLGSSEETKMAAHTHSGGDTARCADALANVQAFLRGELDESLADDIREHLLACENCLDNFHIEELITSLVQRCNANPECCSEQLRARIASLHVALA